MCAEIVVSEMSGIGLPSRGNQEGSIRMVEIAIWQYSVPLMEEKRCSMERLREAVDRSGTLVMTGYVVALSVK
jgi:hypothetical protein